MKTPIRVLIIEDSENDKELLLLELTRGGYNPEYECVETSEALNNALDKQSWDIILSDYAMPEFDGLTALKTVKARGLDIPFILISGTIGEDIAVAAMKSGAQDYIMKGKLARLVPAIERELKEAGIRRQAIIAEEELRQSRRELQEYFENDISADYVVSAEGEIFNCNKTFLDMFGFKGKLPSEKFNITQLFKNPDDRKELIRQVKQNGKVENFLVDFIDQDGKTIHSILNSIGKFDESGELISSRGYIVDITELKKAEEALKKSESIYRKLIEKMPDGVYKTTHDGKVIDLNPAMLRILGYSNKAELMGITIGDEMYFDPSEREQMTIEGLNKELISYRLRKKDGSEVWVEDHGWYSYNESGEIIFHEGVLRDITERKKAENDSIIRNKLNLLKAKVWEAVSTKSTNEDGLINLMLEEAGNVLNISRATFLRLDEKRKLFVTKYQWYQPEVGTTKQVEIPAKYVASYLPADYVQIPLQLNKTIRFFATPILKLYHIKSWLAVPYGNTQNPSGLFTFTDCNKERMWSDIEIEVLTDLSKILETFSMKRKAEESLLKLSHAMEQSPVSIVITDIKGTIEYGNPKVTEITGYQTDELMGKNPRIFNSGEKPKSEYKMLWDTISSGKEWSGEFHNKKKNGELYWENASISPILNEKGEITHYVAVKEDITERKHAEEEISMLAHSLKSINECVSITDLDDNIVYINESFLRTYGYSENELVGENISMVLSSNNPTEVLTEIQQDTLLGGWKGELMDKRKDGSEFPVSVSTTVIKGKDGKPLGLIGVASDITERRDAEQKLINALEKSEESDRLKTAFLLNMSHEIRTPMNGILGFAELLKMPGISSDEQQEYIGFIKKSSDRMLNIINDLVDISKIESRLVKVDPDQSNINEQTEFVYTSFKLQAEEKGLNLSYRNGIPDGEAIITTDRKKVDSILSNLVKNAIKYTDKGTIEFGYTLKPFIQSLSRDVVQSSGHEAVTDVLEFYVKDTGIGIPVDRQQAIFERFVQADIEDKRAFQGAGLGLSIAKGYVEMLGGNIWVESEEGKGSTFRFTIPYLPVQKIKTADYTHASPGIAAEQIKKLKILVVEDDDTSVILLMVMFKEYSRETLIADTGTEAIEICRSNPDVDLVLMDIKMRGMDGYEATQQIRQFNKDVVIIAQTAFTKEGDREKALEAGCNDYISKPIENDRMMYLIEKYFSK